MAASTHRGLPAFGCFAVCFLGIPATAHAADKKLSSFVQTQLNHAKSSFAEERHDEAIEILDETIKLYPTIGVIYTIRGLYLQRIDRDAEAVKDFSRAISNGSKDSGVYAARALSKRTLGVPDGAISDCTTAINLDNKSSHAFAIRGWVRKDLGQYELALDDLNQSILLDPRNELAYMIRALCKSEAGDELGAVRDIATYKTLEALAKSQDAHLRTGKPQSTVTEKLR